jgi:hypothetical protein
MALDPSQGEAPDEPIAVAVSEWKALAALARKEGKTLSKLGVGAKQFATLEAFARRLAELDKAWLKIRARHGKSQKRDEAETLKRKLLAAGEWACRHDDEALYQLARIREGSGLADTIQDLRDLAAFWDRHADEMARTKLTAREVSRARALAEDMELMAMEEAADAEANHVLELRNRCFWAGNAVAGEIRQCGRYAFSEQPAKAAKFVARFRAERTRRRRRAGADGAPASAPAINVPPASAPLLSSVPRAADSVPYGPGDGA